MPTTTLVLSVKNTSDMPQDNSALARASIASINAARGWGHCKHAPAGVEADPWKISKAIWGSKTGLGECYNAHLI